MKYSLLDIVQTVLSSIEGDEVNSITDTTEAFQVAQIVKRVYNTIASTTDLPEHNIIGNLTASTSSTPVIMYLPDTISRVKWIKYDTRLESGDDPSFSLIQPKSLFEFLSIMHDLSDSDTEVSSFNLTVNGSDVFKILYRNDTAPTCYTTFDDGTIVFDSYDSSVDANLQSSKTSVFGVKPQTFLLADSYIPNLDDEQFDLLLNESVAVASVELKQQQNPKAERFARNGWIRLQRTKTAVPLETRFEELPDYGRK